MKIIFVYCLIIKNSSPSRFNKIRIFSVNVLADCTCCIASKTKLSLKLSNCKLIDNNRLIIKSDKISCTSYSGGFSIVFNKYNIKSVPIVSVLKNDNNLIYKNVQKNNPKTYPDDLLVSFVRLKKSLLT